MNDILLALRFQRYRCYRDTRCVPCCIIIPTLSSKIRFSLCHDDPRSLWTGRQPNAFYLQHMRAKPLYQLSPLSVHVRALTYQNRLCAFVVAASGPRTGWTRIRLAKRRTRTADVVKPAACPSGVTRTHPATLRQLMTIGHASFKGLEGLRERSRDCRLSDRWGHRTNCTLDMAGLAHRNELGRSRRSRACPGASRRPSRGRYSTHRACCFPALRHSGSRPNTPPVVTSLTSSWQEILPFI